MVEVKTAWIDQRTGVVHLLLDLQDDQLIDVTVSKNSYALEGAYSFARRILEAVIAPRQAELALPGGAPAG